MSPAVLKTSLYSLQSHSFLLWLRPSHNSFFIPFTVCQGLPMHREYGSEQQTRSWLSSNIPAVLGLVSRTGQAGVKCLDENKSAEEHWMGGGRTQGLLVGQLIWILKCPWEYVPWNRTLLLSLTCTLTVCFSTVWVNSVLHLQKGFLFSLLLNF